MVNFVLGAAEVRIRDFTLGTLIGVMPGILGVSFFAYQITSLIRKPTAANVAGLVALLLILVPLLRWLHRKLNRVHVRPGDVHDRDQRAVV